MTRMAIGAHIILDEVIPRAGDHDQIILIDEDMGLANGTTEHNASKAGTDNSSIATVWQSRNTLSRQKKEVS